MKGRTMRPFRFPNRSKLFQTWLSVIWWESWWEVMVGRIFTGAEKWWEGKLVLMC